MTENETTAPEQDTAASGTEDGPKAPQGSGAGTRMPKVTFTTFVLSLASSGLVQLGEVPDPESGKMQENIMMAQHTIDVLAMLQEKTQGCLNGEEAQLMDALLYELRMKYVLKST